MRITSQSMAKQMLRTVVSENLTTVISRVLMKSSMYRLLHTGVVSVSVCHCCYLVLRSKKYPLFQQSYRCTELGCAEKYSKRSHPFERLELPKSSRINIQYDANTFPAGTLLWTQAFFGWIIILWWMWRACLANIVVETTLFRSLRSVDQWDKGFIYYDNILQRTLFTNIRSYSLDWLGCLPEATARDCVVWYLLWFKPCWVLRLWFVFAKCTSTIGFTSRLRGESPARRFMESQQHGEKASDWRNIRSPLSWQINPMWSKSPIKVANLIWGLSKLGSKISTGLVASHFLVTW